jgi:protocatechuate 3,4-dioxygenase alpha subunit
VLRLIEQEKRRETLLARREEREGAVVYRIEFRLQGEDETVFFDV